MDDLLGSLMQGGERPPDQDETGEAGDPLQQMLQGLTGGGGSQQPDAQGGMGALPGGMDLSSLLQGVLGGGGLPGGSGQTPQGYAEEGGTGAPGGLDFSSLLQGLAGGGGLPGGGGQASQGVGAEGGTGAAAGGLDLGSLLQAVLGGGGLPGGSSQAPSGGGGGLGSLLGAILGGGDPAAQASSPFAPIVTGLAEKLGLPPEVAQMVVTFVLGKLMGQRMRGPSAGSSGLDNIVQRMNAGQLVRKADIRSTGLAKELSAQSGLDRATAEASLQHVMNALGGQAGTGL